MSARMTIRPSMYHDRKRKDRTSVLAPSRSARSPRLSDAGHTAQFYHRATAASGATTVATGGEEYHFAAPRVSPRYKHTGVRTATRAQGSVQGGACSPPAR